MEWLKEHVYLAAWLALPVTVIVAFIQNKKAAVMAESFPLRKMMAYLMFLICFPLSLTPTIELGVRGFVGTLAVCLLIVILLTPNSMWQK